MVTQTLRNPVPFFKHQAQFGKLRLSGVVMLFAGIAYALQSIAVYYALGADRTNLANAITVEFAILFLEPLVVWAIFTVVFYLFAKLLGARIRTGRLFKLTGLGFLPIIMTGLVWSVGHYMAVRGQTVSDVRVGVLGDEREAYATLIEQVVGDPILVATTLIGCVFILASIYLWGLAIEYSSDLERRRTIVIAAVPAIAYVVYSMLQVL